MISVKKAFRWKKWFVRLLLLGTLLIVGCAAGVVWTLPGKEMAAAAKAAKSFPSSGKPLNALRSGNENSPLTIYFVHGTPGEASNWGGFLAEERLNQSYHLIAVDRLGFGKSEPKKAVPQLAQHAQALAYEARKRRGKKVWVGHSYGVPVLGSLVAQFPELVDGLVLIAGPADPQKAGRTWYQSLAATHLGQAVISKNLKHANVEMLSLKEELKQLDSAWRTIQVPTSLIYARDDLLVHPASLAFLQERIPANHVEVTDLKKGNHFLIWSHQELVLKQIENVISRL